MTNTLSAVLPSSMELGEIVEQVWSSFLDGEIVVISEDDLPAEPGRQMVASVSIIGAWTGHLMIVTGTECARRIAGGMFQTEPDEISTAEVADALGEIANMVGGSVKGMIGVAAALSLPQVVLDASALVSPDAEKLVCVSAQWNGQLVEISLWERSSTGSAAVSGSAGMGE